MPSSSLTLGKASRMGVGMIIVKRISNFGGGSGGDEMEGRRHFFGPAVRLLRICGGP